MNVAAPGGNGDRPAGIAVDHQKIEGETGFWEPTPGAVIAIARRLGYGSTTLLGYGDDLASESAIIERHWGRHLRDVHAGTRTLYELPRARVHMILEKERGSIRVEDPTGAGVTLPEWDLAIREVAERKARS